MIRAGPESGLRGSEVVEGTLWGQPERIRPERWKKEKSDRNLLERKNPERNLRWKGEGKASMES
jgi:hypothetical protein